MIVAVLVEFISSVKYIIILSKILFVIQFKKKKKKMKSIPISVIRTITKSRIADSIYDSIGLKWIPIPYHVMNLAVLQYNNMTYKETFLWDE